MAFQLDSRIPASVQPPELHAQSPLRTMGDVMSLRNQQRQGEHLEMQRQEDMRDAADDAAIREAWMPGQDGQIDYEGGIKRLFAGGHGSAAMKAQKAYWDHVKVQAQTAREQLATHESGLKFFGGLLKNVDNDATLGIAKQLGANAPGPIGEFAKSLPDSYDEAKPTIDNIVSATERQTDKIREQIEAARLAEFAMSHGYPTSDDPSIPEAIRNKVTPTMTQAWAKSVAAGVRGASSPQEYEKMRQGLLAVVPASAGLRDLVAAHFDELGPDSTPAQFAAAMKKATTYLTTPSQEAVIERGDDTADARDAAAKDRKARQDAADERADARLRLSERAADRADAAAARGGGARGGTDQGIGSAAAARQYSSFVKNYDDRHQMEDVISSEGGKTTTGKKRSGAAAPSLQKWFVMSPEEREKVLNDPTARIDDSEMQRRMDTLESEPADAPAPKSSTSKPASHAAKPQAKASGANGELRHVALTKAAAERLGITAADVGKKVVTVKGGEKVVVAKIE